MISKLQNSGGDRVESARLKGVFWWVTAILAPIGVFGGPLELANMLAGVIEWKGPIGYLVAFWDRTVGHTFEVIFDWIAGVIGLPAPPWWLSDYLTLGVLLGISRQRARVLIPEPPLHPLLAKLYKSPTPLGLLEQLGGTAKEILLWPILISASTLSVVVSWFGLLRARLERDPNAGAIVFGRRGSGKTLIGTAVAETYERRRRANLERAFLTAGPFALFFLLWIANALLD